MAWRASNRRGGDGRHAGWDGEGSRDDRVEIFRRLTCDQLPRLYSIARRLVGDEEAEDAVQDCLLKALQRIHQLHEDAAGPAWLTSIAMAIVVKAHLPR